MEYRVNQRTGDKISAIGLGTSYIAESDEKTAVEALVYAYEHGINYADLAKAGDTMAVSHYQNMELHADSCVQCGHCESRCPFQVKQMARMHEINSFFER